MNGAVFADTFCWIALTNPADRFNRDAHALDLAAATIINTDEVLVEYLTFFAAEAWRGPKPRTRPQGFCASATCRSFRNPASLFLLA